MTCLIWKKTAIDVANLSFWGLVRLTLEAQLNCNAIG
jgi:hypothetical protein